MGFCSVCRLQLFYFFSLSFKKNKCAASAVATKTMTKKLTATPQQDFLSRALCGSWMPLSPYIFILKRKLCCEDGFKLWLQMIAHNPETKVCAARCVGFGSSWPGASGRLCGRCYRASTAGCGNRKGMLIAERWPTEVQGRGTRLQHWVRRPEGINVLRLRSVLLPNGMQYNMVRL